MQIGLAADLLHRHAGGVEVEIEVEVDIDVEALCDLEDARDLAMRVAVGIGAATDQIGALFASLDQQFLRAGIVQQALLGKTQISISTAQA